VDGIRFLVVAALIAIVASLGTALYHLASGRGDSGKMVRALAIRVALSIALFILLIFAWRSGLIAPHGIQR
jgi:ABC-type amino acid transport system permease subunit